MATRESLSILEKIEKAHRDRKNRERIEKLEREGGFSIVQFRNQQGQLTGKSIDRAVWRVWEHVRGNAGSLNSDVHCKRIRLLIDAVVSSVQARLDRFAAEVIDAKRKMREAKRIKAATEKRRIENEWLCSMDKEIFD